MLEQLGISPEDREQTPVATRAALALLWQQNRMLQNRCAAYAQQVQRLTTEVERIKRLELEVAELREFLGGEETQDVEVLFVIAVMGEVAAWCLGEEDRWRTTANIFRSRLDGRVPDPELFAGRGAYGEYFAHQAQAQSQTQSRHLI